MKRYFFILIYSCMMIIMSVKGTTAYAQEITPSCACSCIKPFFQYLLSSGRLFTKETDHILISTLVTNANSAGYNVSYSGCPILSKNINKYFYALTTDTTGTVYKARIGDCTVILESLNSTAVAFKRLLTKDCDNSGNISFNYTGPVHVKFPITRSETSVFSSATNNIYPRPAGVGENYPIYATDTTSGSIYSAGYSTRFWYSDRLNNMYILGYSIKSYFAADPLNIPTTATVISASLHMFAKPEGFHPPEFPNAHTTLAETDNGFRGSLWVLNSPWNYSMSAVDLFNVSGIPFYYLAMNDHFEDLICDITDGLKNNHTAYDNGFLMDGIASDMDVPAYYTFCTQKYPDVNKRPYIDVVYMPDGSGAVARLRIDTCYTCAEMRTTVCYSAVTDTSVNPYTYGLAGNWRAYRSYVYYGNRSETNPSQITDTRKDGTIKDYSGFWKVAGDSWKPNIDTTRWVWNSEITLFNRRGLELENKDPLGRYNAGLYGYDDALPIAVVQNARYRESAFDGFEDYFFGGTPCDGPCMASRNFDFSSYKSNLDSTEQHTGKYSLRIAKNNSAGITAIVLPDTANAFGLSFNTANNNCSAGGQVLKSVIADKNALLPGFSPVAGKRLVISAWVKEAQECKGETYTGNQISIVIGRTAGNITIIATPQGGIIEGWQRYEQVIDIPADAATLSVNMQAIGNTTVYFDDLRIHPYNANMKSFVYNPENLRLMAELDENNYASLYEYDDDGTLIRLKKETERGIKTISESRSGLLIE